MRILGIDPGLRFTGYGCVETPVGPEAASRVRVHRVWEAGNEAKLVEAGIIRLKLKASVASRLRELDRDLEEILGRCKPQVVAVEKLYAHYKHPLTAIIMGHARGVVLLGVERADLKLVELAATEVKKSLTGNGHASKQQMQAGVKAQLGLAATPEPADVADAIAIALCALRRAR